MAFLGRHQGYLSLRAGSPVLKQVASGDRAIGICNTDLMHYQSGQDSHVPS